jgi:hypothetical protein
MTITAQRRPGQDASRTAPLLTGRVDRFPWGVFAAWTSVIAGAFVMVVNVLRTAGF